MVFVLGFISLVMFLACLVIGFFGGEQMFQNMYPEHKELIHFISEMIRIAFWILLVIIIVIVAFAVIGMIASARM